MKRTVVINVNGILTWPGSATAWTDVATTELISQGIATEKFEYWAMPMTRRLMQHVRAQRLAEMIKHHYQRGAFVVAWGHSNGCDLILRALRMGCRLHSVHLMAPAVEEDMEANGLNHAIYTMMLGRAYIYTGGKDWPMKLAHWTGKLLKPLGLGYGTMGLTGPINTEPMLEAHVDHMHVPDYGHGTWFHPEHMHNTLRLVSNELP